MKLALLVIGMALLMSLPCVAVAAPGPHQVVEILGPPRRRKRNMSSCGAPLVCATWVQSQPSSCRNSVVRVLALGLHGPTLMIGHVCLGQALAGPLRPGGYAASVLGGAFQQPPSPPPEIHLEVARYGPAARVGRILVWHACCLRSVPGRASRRRFAASSSGRHRAARTG